MNPLPQPVKSDSDDHRNWLPTPIDWSVNFPRSPQHLSNQLRGKRFNADRPQLQLFDDTYHNLSAEVRQEVDKHDIDGIGFDLSIAQQRAYDAALFLVAATGGKSKRIVITPEEWLKAYGVETRQRNTRGRAEMSSYEREEAFTALASLGLMPWLISYDALVNGRWKTRQEVATLWQIGTEKDKAIQQPGQSAARPLTPQDLLSVVQNLKNAEKISINFHDIWFDQRDTFYFYKPTNLYQRIGQAITGNIRRRNKHTHTFIDWVFSEVGRIRVESRHEQNDTVDPDKPQQTWTFSEDMTALAIQLRMTSQVSKRNWTRIRQALDDSAILAQRAQIITEYRWDGDQIHITFNQETFRDLDQYHQTLEADRAERQRRRNLRQKKPEHAGVSWPYARPVGEYSYSHLQDMKKGQLAELAKIRERQRTAKSLQTPLTAEQQERDSKAIAYHQAVVAMIDNALVPKPPTE